MLLKTVDNLCVKRNNILGSKNIGATSLTFRGHVTSSVM